MPLPLDPPWAYEGPDEDEDEPSLRRDDPDPNPPEPMEDRFAAERYFEAYDARMDRKYA